MLAAVQDVDRLAAVAARAYTRAAMRSFITLPLVLLAALLFSLVRTVIVHSAHVGPIEWVVVCLLVLALVLAIVHSSRRAA
jgi:hypothetical protein